MNAADEEITAGLIGAGIGIRYHKRTFAEFPDGPGFAEWIKAGHAAQDVNAGGGYSIWGMAPAHDFMFVMARAFYLTGMAVKVTTLARLVDGIVGDGSLKEIDASQALFINGFFVRDYGVSPLSPMQRHKVEDFLMQRIDDAKAIFLQSTDMIANTTPWWSNMLLQRVASVNREVHIA